MMTEFLESILFEIAGRSFNGRLVVLLSILFIGAIGLTLLTRLVLPSVLDRFKVLKQDRVKVYRILRYIIILLIVLAAVRAIGLNIDLIYWTDKYSLTLALIIDAFLIIQIARVLDWFIEHVIGVNYRNRNNILPRRFDPHDEVETKKSGNRTVQYIAWSLAGMFIVQRLGIDLMLYHHDSFSLRISSIFLFIFVVLLVRLFAWFLINVVLYKVYRSRQLAPGSQYAINQLLKYILYIFGLIIALDAIGINMSLLIGGAAALLVGIGLGLQQIFNDLFSGIVLLFERSIEVGHIIEVDGEVGVVSKIGLRTSLVETRDHVTLILPNSRVVSGKVINWNHEDKRVRFVVEVSVAYGSDTELVKKILLDCTKEHIKILSYPQAFVRFTNFGESALTFQLNYWSTELMAAEDVKSDLRFRIDQAFREHDIQIPFPQREIWMRKVND